MRIVLLVLAMIQGGVFVWKTGYSPATWQFWACQTPVYLWVAASAAYGWKEGRIKLANYLMEKAGKSA